jgi:hypothetical protein
LHNLTLCMKLSCCLFLASRIQKDTFHQTLFFSDMMPRHVIGWSLTDFSKEHGAFIIKGLFEPWTLEG